MIRRLARSVLPLVLLPGLVGAALLGVCCQPNNPGTWSSPVGGNCYECHIDFRQEELTVVHVRHGVSCVHCHGPSQAHMEDEVRRTPADATFRGRAIDVFCLTCHDRKDYFKVPAHAAEADEPEPVRRTCTQCHGDHRLMIVPPDPSAGP